MANPYRAGSRGPNTLSLFAKRMAPCDKDRFYGLSFGTEAFFPAQAVPFNADIDPRDMELLDSGDGYAGTVDAEIDLTVLPAQPGYDFGVKCN